jgi:hypothetical protein
VDITPAGKMCAIAVVAGPKQQPSLPKGLPIGGVSGSIVGTGSGVDELCQLIETMQHARRDKVPAPPGVLSIVRTYTCRPEEFLAAPIGVSTKLSDELCF